MEMSKKSLFGKAVGLVAIGGVLYTAMGWPFFHYMTYVKKEEKSGEKKPGWSKLNHTQTNHPRHWFEEEYEAAKSWCMEQPVQEWYIDSRDGKRLHASWLPAENAKRIVLLFHGYRGNRFGSISGAARFLHDHETSLLFVDQRCCGESGGTYITFGAKEQYDVLDWLKRVQAENADQKLPIYLYGQSMGATTVLLSAGHELPEEVKGLIADCGFHSMKQQLRDLAAEWFHFHRIGALLLRLNLFCRLFGHFHMKETDTTEALKKNTRPVLFFHGEADTYVQPENTVRNFELCRAPKELALIPGAMHLCSYYAAPELYQGKLTEFFERYDKAGIRHTS